MFKITKEFSSEFVNGIIGRLIKSIMENKVDVEHFYKIDLKRNTSIPIYRQIVDFVDNEISRSSIKIGNRLPSINEASKEKNISRDTVEKAYKILRQKGSIQSIPKRGYFVRALSKKRSTRLLVLVNKLIFNKLQILDCICNACSTNPDFEIEIHFVDGAAFRAKIDECDLPSVQILAVGFGEQHFPLVENNSQIKVNGNNIDCDFNKLINESDDYRKNSISLLNQNFEKDFYLIMQEMSALSKYDKLVLVLSKKNFQENGRGVENALNKFCNDHYYKYDICNGINDKIKIRKGNVFLVFDEGDLVHLLRLSKTSELKLGLDVGIIGFNDSPMKALMAISVISIDFNILGELITSLIGRKIKGNIKNEYQFVDRGSV